LETFGQDHGAVSMRHKRLVPWNEPLPVQISGRLTVQKSPQVDQFIRG
jgi:hypothetical protein